MPDPHYHERQAPLQGQRQFNLPEQLVPGHIVAKLTKNSKLKLSGDWRARPVMGGVLSS